MKVVRYHSKEFQRLFIQREGVKKRIFDIVQRIVQDVRVNGDAAVLKYTKKYDGVRLTVKSLKVAEEEINGAYQDIDPAFIARLKVVIENISSFYRKQIKKSWRMRKEEGVILGEQVVPLDSVGIYIPAGTAPLVSSVYMSVVPAKISGVKKIFICTPPDRQGNINPHILAVANLLNVRDIYQVGGAQAIAAMAWGTRTIPRVDKIVGPGNIFVTEAKRQVFGYVDIDMTAGPSEVVVIANQYANNEFIRTDLEAQAEHARGTAILVTTSKAQVKFFKNISLNGYIIHAKNIQNACEIANAIAPEHLEVMVKDVRSVMKYIHNAGAVFIGPYSPTAVGDYIAGPSHILPTGGTARFFSGISLSDFTKHVHIIQYSKKALEKIKDAAISIAQLEHMEKHAESIMVRCKESS